jgi:hypothetical protein
METSVLKVIRNPFSAGKTVGGDPLDHQSFLDLMRKLDDGWQIEPPVYIMTSPAQRSQIIIRMVIWRDGRPQVVTVPDTDDIRQYLADHNLSQEPL